MEMWVFGQEMGEEMSEIVNQGKLLSEKCQLIWCYNYKIIYSSTEDSGMARNATI